MLWFIVFILSIILAIMSTYWYMRDKIVISSGIEGTFDLYWRQFGIFFFIWFLVGATILYFINEYGHIIGIILLLVAVGLYFGSPDTEGTAQYIKIFRSVVIGILGVTVFFMQGHMDKKPKADTRPPTVSRSAQQENLKSNNGKNNISNNVANNDGNTQKAHNDYKDSLEKEIEKFYANHGAKDLYSDEPILLGNIPLGLVESDVKKLLGKAEKTEQRSGGNTVYHYNNNGYGVICKEGRVTGLFSDSPQITTEAGIHTGSNLQDFLQKYGTNYTLSNYDGLDLYEYNGNNQGKKIILRFAVKPDTKKVNYILLRYAD